MDDQTMTLLGVLFGITLLLALSLYVSSQEIDGE